MNLSHVIPDVTEYLELRSAAGLGAKDEATASAALRRTEFSVVARDEQGELIGMGRLIGDGCYYQIVDVIIRPSQENNGAKHAIMSEIADYLNRDGTSGAEVVLLADVPSVGFYQTYGFQFTYPNAISLWKTR